ncbi:MAG: hypothetical protein LBR21_09070, partial [Propionibacteriaceae bacterium]|nr:hypothetical protein [Propionibacteriaceae bacterium]
DARYEFADSTSPPGSEVEPFPYYQIHYTDAQGVERLVCFQGGSVEMASEERMTHAKMTINLQRIQNEEWGYIYESPEELKNSGLLKSTFELDGFELDSRDNNITSCAWDQLYVPLLIGNEYLYGTRDERVERQQRFLDPTSGFSFVNKLTPQQMQSDWGITFWVTAIGCYKLPGCKKPSSEEEPSEEITAEQVNGLIASMQQDAEEWAIEHQETIGYFPNIKVGVRHPELSDDEDKRDATYSYGQYQVGKYKWEQGT